MKKLLLPCLFLVSQIVFTSAQPAFAEEQVYGWQLMSEEERVEHRNRMRSFQTDQEREAYRLEHHKHMQERAGEKGVTLPEEPMPRGKGMGGPGAGSSPGMGGGKR